MALLAAVLSLVLSLAHGKLRVDDGPRVDDADTMLPGANCGAFGLPGCRAFAESAVDGHVAPAACTVAEPPVQELIADLIGVEVGEEEQRVARLACAGGTNVARQRARYVGEPTCVAADLVGGGGKRCAWGVSATLTAWQSVTSTPSPWTSTRCRRSTIVAAPPVATAWMSATATCSPSSR